MNMITNIFNYLHISISHNPSPLYLSMKDLNRDLCFFFLCYNVVVFKHRLNRPSYDLLPFGVPRAQCVPRKCVSLATWLGTACFVERYTVATFLSHGGAGLPLGEESRLLGLLYPSKTPVLNRFPDDLKFPYYSPTSLFEGREGQEKKPSIELRGSDNQSFPPPSILICSPGHAAGQRPSVRGAWGSGGGGPAGSTSSVCPSAERPKRAGWGWGSPGERGPCGLVWRLCWRRCAPGGRGRAPGGRSRADSRR